MTDYDGFSVVGYNPHLQMVSNGRRGYWHNLRNGHMNVQAIPVYGRDWRRKYQ